jgi:uncharacterized protein (TIGR02246 family)
MVLVVTLSAGFACAPAVPPQPTVEQDTAAINQVRAAYVSAWKKGDVEGTARGFADDAVLLSPGNEPRVSGRSAIAKSNEDFFTHFTPNDAELTPEEIKIIGDWAFESGIYKMTARAKANDQTISQHGRYLVLLQRQADGSWKIARLIDSADSAPPAK